MLFSRRWPIIATLHFPALPGAPGFRGDWKELKRAVLRDAEAYIAGGVDAIMLENFGDVPFFPQEVPPVTIAHFAALACEVRRRTDLPLGINVLRNDGRAALAIAQAAEAQFIRVNVLCGARLTDQGIVQGAAHQLLRERAAQGAQTIQILADVQVKHSAALADRELGDEVQETLERSGADAVIVTGRATGDAVDVDSLRVAKRAAGERPVFVGSGATDENVGRLAPDCDGLIVGSFFKAGGQVTGRVELERVERLVRAVERLRSEAPGKQG